MKRALRIISVVLCVFMLASTVCSAEFFSYDGLNESSAVEVSNIVFTDSVSGAKLTSLTPNTTVKASVTVKKSNDSYTNVSLVLSLFCGNEFVSSTTQYLDISNGAELPLTNTISIPELSGLSLYAYIWDGVNTAVPLASSALFGSDNIDVEAILVDGEAISGFDMNKTEYTIPLDSACNEYPVVALRTADLSAKVDIKELYSFTSSVKQIVAKVTSANGSAQRVYTLTFERENPEVTDISVNAKTNTFVKSVVTQPSWNTNPPSAAPVNNGTTNYTASRLPSASSKLYSDLNDYYISIAPQLVGAELISFPSTLKSDTTANSSSNNALVSFRLNHSADVYVATFSDSAPQFEKLDFEDEGVLAYRITPDTSSYKYNAINFFKKSYTVNKGETVTVELPYTSSSAMYSVIVKFSEGEPRISDAYYTLKTGAKTNVEINKYYDPVTAYGAPSNISSCLFKTKCFSDNQYHTLYMMPEDAQGADALVLPMYTGSKNIQSISFKLNRTASVYFCWRDVSGDLTIDKMTSLGNEGYTRYSSKVQYRVLSQSGLHNFPASGGIFKKDFYLKPGETKEIVFDGIPTSTSGIGYIYVTDISYDYYNSDGYINIEPDSSFYFEAEDSRAQINSPFAKTTKASQSAVYVSTSAGTNTNGTPVYDDTKALIYPISVEESGKYYIWMKIYAQDTGADSFFMSFDNETPIMVTPAYKTEWQWMIVKAQYLTRGTHTLKFYHRETNIAFDKLAITKQSNYTPENFSWGEQVYNPGNVTPPANTHPRVLFTKDDIPAIKANLTHPQNQAVYEKLLSDAGYNTNGYFSGYEGMTGANADMATVSAASDCAFLYAVNGDKMAGEKAVRIFTNLVDTLTTVGGNVTYISRSIGHSLFNCALVYDWCYDLIDSETKEKFIGLFYIMASQLETGWPPTKQKTIHGHGLEGELLKDYLACGIAVYDEEPAIYNNVAGRIINEIVPVKDYYSQSMQLFEGATYGPYREFFTMMSAYLFKAIGYGEVYEPISYQLYSLFYNRKPDGRFISSGDDANEDLWGYTDGFNSCLFLAGNFYKDSYLKREYARSGHMGNTTINDSGMVTPLIHLITNDVSVDFNKSFKELPLTAFYNYPSGVMSARTGWEEGKNTDVLHVQMNILEQFYGGHQHLDSGHFDIYYKGTLALDTGIYESNSWKDANGTTVTDLAYGSAHDFGYHKRTIAHNSMLVYNPNESQSNSYYTNNDGGQADQNKDGVVRSAENLTDGTTDFGYVVSYDFGEDLYAPEYSYLKGNLKKGYGSKVTDYTRTFMFLNFKDEDYPGALIVYDNVTGAKTSSWSSYSTFKKSWLLHSMEEPTVSGTTTTVTATTLPGNNGRLINNTLLPSNPVISKVGGKGNEFNVNGTNFTAVPKSDYNEYGVWRVEISPTPASTTLGTNRYNANEEFLNVMQMSENSSDITPLSVSHITSVSGYNGVKIKDRVVYLKKTEALNSSALTLAATTEESMQIIDGLEVGVWTVKNSSGTVIATKNVYKDHNTLSFTAPAGTYTLTRTTSTNTETKDYSLLGRKISLTEAPVDIKINNIYESFRTGTPYSANGNIYVPASEIAEKLGVSYSYSSGTLKLNGKTISTGYHTLLNNVCYLALNRVSSNLGATVSWNTVSNIVFVTK